MVKSSNAPMKTSLMEEIKSNLQPKIAFNWDQTQLLDAESVTVSQCITSPRNSS